MPEQEKPLPKVKIYRHTEQMKQDPRGWAFFPFQAGPDIRPPCDTESLHLVMSQPGAVRGNHYHEHSAEWFCVFGGRAELYYEENGVVRTEPLDRDDLVVYIPPGVPHTIKNIGSTPVYLLAFREKTAENPHTKPYPLV
jgi:UDP-2-acetamido-2,6-beta-L-arabino-hexul-4-ose reductase